MRSSENSNQFPATTLISSLICVVLGLIASECFLRLIAPYPLFYSTWFEGRIHIPDDELGFVFSPNYRGAMRHFDKTWHVPLELDEHGLRPVCETLGGKPKQEIVLLGGVSMAFSMGLTSQQSLANQIAKHSDIPIRVHTLSWPGFDLRRDIAKFERFFDADFRPSVTIAFLYTDDDFRSLHKPFLTAIPKMDADLFQLNDDVVILDSSASQRWIGRLYYQSYTLAGVCREFESVVVILTSGVKRMWELSGTAHEMASTLYADGPIPNEGTNDLLAELQEKMAAKGCVLQLVALPNQKEMVGPWRLSTLVPENIPTLDVREALEHNESDWKASGHYGEHSAEILGAEIARAIQPILVRQRHIEP